MSGAADAPAYAQCVADFKRHTRRFKIMIDADVEIRKAKSGDIVGIAAMVERYWRFEGLSGFDHPLVCGQLSRVISDETLGNITVAGVGATLIGYLITVYVFSLEHLGLTAEIDEFYVEPEHRSRGAGSSMLAAAECAASDAGCTNLSLQLGENNRRAREIYSRHGFSPRCGYVLLEKKLEADK